MYANVKYIVHHRHTHVPEDVHVREIYCTCTYMYTYVRVILHVHVGEINCTCIQIIKSTCSPIRALTYCITSSYFGFAASTKVGE